MKIRYGTSQIIFIALMVAMDFSFGFVFKNIVGASGVFNVVRIDMVVPIVLMMITKLMICRFGTLIIYETSWGLLSCIAMPGAFGLPGLLKIIPALLQGVTYDLIFLTLNKVGNIKVYIASFIGGLTGYMVAILLKVIIGYPWENFTKILFGINTLTYLIISIIGAWLSIIIWHRIRNIHFVQRLVLDND